MTDLQAGRRKRWTANRTEAKALEAALLAATGKRWAVVYHTGTARGWFDILPPKRDRRTVVEYSEADKTTSNPTGRTFRTLRGEELEAQQAKGYGLDMSQRQIATLKRVFGEHWHNSNVPGDENWLIWAASGRKGEAPRMGSRDWD